MRHVAQSPAAAPAPSRRLTGCEPSARRSEPAGWRLVALHKTCTSGAFVLAFLGAGIPISTLGVQAMFLFAGLLLVVIILIVRPHLRALWPEPAGEQAVVPLPLPQPGAS